MTDFELLSIIIASVALVVSTLAFLDVKGIKKSASASIEWSINERISNTKKEVSEIAHHLIPLTSKPASKRSEYENVMIEAYTLQFNLAVENNLNAYEAACANYLDKKVDKKRVKKLLKTEIKKTVESPDLKKYFDAVSSNYKAILKVYDEWENLEQ